jgi:hypothetical protein
MKNFLKGQFFAALIGVFVLFSCAKKDENTPAGPYSDGVVVLNEGVFMKNNADLSFISNDLSKSETNVFLKENGTKAGDVLQSYALSGDKLYLVLNMSNRVEILSRASLKKNASIAELANPRFMQLSENNKAYISNWGNPFGTPAVAPFLAVVDLASNKVSKKLYTGSGAEGLLKFKNRLLVGASFSDKIYVYDTDKDVLLDSLSTAPHSPYAMCADENGKIWVMTYSFDGSYNATEGAILRFDGASFAKEASLKISSGGASIKSALQYDKNSKKLYFMTSKGVFAFSTSATSLPSAPFIEGNFSGIGIKNDGKFYLGTADFVSESGNNVKVFDASGKMLKQFNSGYAPNAFVF